jgi:hypothetical protein
MTASGPSRRPARRTLMTVSGGLPEFGASSSPWSEPMEICSTFAQSHLQQVTKSKQLKNLLSFDGSKMLIHYFMEVVPLVQITIKYKCLNFYCF